MKKLFLVFVITSLLICSNAIGQSQPPIKYCYMQVYLAINKGDILCEVYFAKVYELPVENKDEIIKKMKEFKTGADVLNYMSDIGWEYVDKSVIRAPDSTIFYFYMFRKQR